MVINGQKRAILSWKSFDEIAVLKMPCPKMSVRRLILGEHWKIRNFEKMCFTEISLNMKNVIQRAKMSVFESF